MPLNGHSENFIEETIEERNVVGDINEFNPGQGSNKAKNDKE